jgi:hypothetical protein
MRVIGTSSGFMFLFECMSASVSCIFSNWKFGRSCKSEVGQVLRFIGIGPRHIRPNIHSEHVWVVREPLSNSNYWRLRHNFAIVCIWSRRAWHFRFLFIYKHVVTSFWTKLPLSIRCLMQPTWRVLTRSLSEFHFRCKLRVRSLRLFENPWRSFFHCFSFGISIIRPHSRFESLFVFMYVKSRYWWNSLFQAIIS